MGAALRPRVRATTAPAPEADQQVVASRGIFYRYLFRVLPRSEFGFLHDAFERFVIEDWKGQSVASIATSPLLCDEILVG
jgi:hypothetical protein